MKEHTSKASLDSTPLCVTPSYPTVCPGLAGHCQDTGIGEVQRDPEVLG